MTAKDLLGAVGKHSRISSLANPSVFSRVTEWVSTGCLPLDIIMGKGVPVGRITEIYGDTSTGKSLLAAHILAETQAAGGIAVLFDSETATDEGVMAAVGVDPGTLVYSIPETIEEVYDDFEDVLEAKKKTDPDGLMTIIWDSVAATSTIKEVEDVAKKGMGAATMGIHARLISQLCRIVNTQISRTRLAMVFVNQTRQKIGVMFGPDKATFGGRAIAYYSSVRLEMKYKGKVKRGKEIIGIDVSVGVVKNKVAKPFGVCKFPIIFDQGIDEAGAILNYLMDVGLVDGSGWRTLTLPNGDELKFQRSGWESLYYQHEQAIRKLVLDEAVQ